MLQYRKPWLDIVRTLAIICVVLCHSVEAFYRPVLLGQGTLSFALWNIENFLFTLGRIGVPLFFATTGALLLPRKYTNANYFYKRSLLPLLLTTEVWIFFYYFFNCLMNHKSINFLQLLMEMLFFKASSLSHMWYMPVILGCYIVLPFIAQLLNSTPNLRQYSLLYYLGIFFFFVIPTINVFLAEAFTNIPKINIQIDTGFWGSCFSFYIISGYLISEHQLLKKFKTHVLSSGIIVAFIFNSIGQYFLYSHHYYKSTWLYWYTDFPIFLIGVFTFELLRRTYNEKTSLKHRTFIEYTSRCSFGIYVIHKPILMILQKLLKHIPSIFVLNQIILLFIVGFFGSLIILYPFKHIWRKTGSVLFHIK